MFWGGKTFTPKTTVQRGNEEINIQDYLQDAFLKAVRKVLDTVGDLEGVLGIEVSELQLS